MQEQVVVEGFEVPKSPDSSYDNMYSGNDEGARDPPSIPPQLQQSLLNHPVSRNNSGALPMPHYTALNHLYIENKEFPKSVMALGFTHRFLSKYVTVVLYKPAPQGVGTSTSS